MKNYSLFLFCLFILSTLSCSKESDPVVDEANQQWIEYCENFKGGEVDYKIDGKDWASGCVEAVYQEYADTTYGYEQKILYLYSFNYDFTFKENSEIEYVLVYWSEITSDGVTETTSGALYYDGFYDYQEAIANPNYEVENIMIYSSDEYADNNVFNITEITETKIKGNLNFKLIEEENGNETLTLSGSFNANRIE